MSFSGAGTEGFGQGEIWIGLARDETEVRTFSGPSFVESVTLEEGAYLMSIASPSAAARAFEGSADASMNASFRVEFDAPLTGALAFRSRSSPRALRIGRRD